MFGENTALLESSRVSSPWDPFLSSPPSEARSPEVHRHLHNGVPKLVPEIEEGNVEYKLKLTDISPARFARLVTQLKWRLLEGGGQAYYELGVADSGALIGLSRADLEQSLETLEMMAGEIGASVIVVKEIEVPPAMVVLADKVSAYINPATGEWTEKMSNRRRRTLARDTDSDSCATPSATETEGDGTDLTDYDDPNSLVPTPASYTHLTGRVTTLTPYAHRLITSNPNRPTAHSSPAIYPIDDDLALFSMEPEPSLDAEDADVEDATADHLTDVPDLLLDIEITPVYKPRPIRHRAHHDIATGTNASTTARRANKNKYKASHHRWHEQTRSPNFSEAPDSLPVPNKQETKALLRRSNRDKRRDERRKANGGVGTVDVHCQPSLGEDGLRDIEPELVHNAEIGILASLEALHVDAQSIGAVVVDRVVATTEVPSDATLSIPGSAGSAHAREGETRDPRLIVEALVVRKMSLDEEFLDFGNLGGFSLS
ncbi:hypothetical protein BDW22DRAFT_1336412 [Trametopsis cervina]|nr:hypothetical protein BDW22DRAFT_1336412 [Trametopsis cervina]